MKVLSIISLIFSSFSSFSDEICKNQIIVGKAANVKYQDLSSRIETKCSTNRFGDLRFCTVKEYYKLELSKYYTVYDRYCDEYVETNTATKTISCTYSHLDDETECTSSCALSYLEPCDYY